MTNLKYSISLSVLGTSLSIISIDFNRDSGSKDCLPAYTCTTKYQNDCSYQVEQCDMYVLVDHRAINILLAFDRILIQLNDVFLAFERLDLARIIHCKMLGGTNQKGVWRDEIMTEKRLSVFYQDGPVKGRITEPTWDWSFIKSSCCCDWAPVTELSKLRSVSGMSCK